MDTHQKFCQLMLKVTSLDVSNGIKQLQTVNTNITLIQLWFSRAEVSEESTPHSCVQKRWCYMCKVYQAWQKTHLTNTMLRFQRDVTPQDAT